MPEHPSTEPALENNRIYKMKTTYHYKMPRHPLHGFHQMDVQNLGNSCSIKWYPAGHSIVPKHPHFIEGAFRGYGFYIWPPIQINKMQTCSCCCGQAFLINNSPLLNSRKFCLGWANPLSYALTNVKRNPEPNLSCHISQNYIIHFGPPKKMGTVHPLKWEVFTKWCSLLIPCGFASASIPPACIRMRCRSTGGFGQSGGRGGHRQGGRTFGTFASCSCGENWVANEKMRQQIRDVRKHDVPVRL